MEAAAGYIEKGSAPTEAERRQIPPGHSMDGYGRCAATGRGFVSLKLISYFRDLPVFKFVYVCIGRGYAISDNFKTDIFYFR